MSLHFENALYSVLEAQEDIKELVSKWKEMTADVPTCVTFRFYDGSSYTMPNFAKMLQNMSVHSVESEPNTLVMRDANGQIFANTVNGTELKVESGNRQVEILPYQINVKSDTVTNYAQINEHGFVVRNNSQSPILTCLNENSVYGRGWGLNFNNVYGNNWGLDTEGLTFGNKLIPANIMLSEIRGGVITVDKAEVVNIDTPIKYVQANGAGAKRTLRLPNVTDFNGFWELLLIVNNGITVEFEFVVSTFDDNLDQIDNTVFTISIPNNQYRRLLFTPQTLVNETTWKIISDR